MQKKNFNKYVHCRHTTLKYPFDMFESFFMLFFVVSFLCSRAKRICEEDEVSWWGDWFFFHSDCSTNILLTQTIILEKCIHVFFSISQNMYLLEKKLARWEDLYILVALCFNVVLLLDEMYGEFLRFLWFSRRVGRF